MANIYDIGDQVRCTGSFTDVNGSAFDPDVIRFKCQTPAGVATTYVYNTDAEVIKSSTGVYYVDLNVDEAGRWYYRFEGEASDGDYQGSEETWFDVDRSVF